MRKICIMRMMGGMFLASALWALSPVPGYSQGLFDEWIVGTYYPSPKGEYARLACRLFEDISDVNFMVHPSGTSHFQQLRMLHSAAGGGSMQMMPGSRIVGADRPEFFIDLNATTMPAVSLASLRVMDKILMGAPSAQDGKRVYDIAEGMASLGPVEAGDVVCIDAASGKLRRSSQAYDDRIAGVISTAPSVYLGTGNGRQPLALSGVVPCKVSAENGVIEPGDVLVSAARPGYAMRASGDRITPGAVVGKALEPFSSGSGTIHILVNKQ